MTADQIIREVLKTPIATNSNTPKMRSVLEHVAARLAVLLPEKGLELRKGSSSESGQTGESRLYILQAGSPSRMACKTWSFQTTSCGYYRPVTPTAMMRALAEILAFVEGF